MAKRRRLECSGSSGCWTWRVCLRLLVDWVTTRAALHLLFLVRQLSESTRRAHPFRHRQQRDRTWRRTRRAPGRDGEEHAPHRDGFPPSPSTHLRPSLLDQHQFKLPRIEPPSDAPAACPSCACPTRCTCPGGALEVLRHLLSSFSLTPEMGISRDSRHKRSASGARRAH